jgi:hypothetical protein
MNETDPLFQEKLSRRGTRMLLALDSGGLRRIISIEILARVQSKLRKSSRNTKLEEVKFPTSLSPCEKRLCARQFSGSFVPVWHPTAGWVV